MDGQQNHKGYFAIIPAIVRYDNQLNGNAKLLYGELTALANEKGYCWATNQYFAELYGVSRRTISGWISSLEKQKYIKTQLNYKLNSKEVANRYIFIQPFPVEGNFYTYGKKLHEGQEENFHTPMEENFQENNTSINNTKNNINHMSGKGEKIPYSEIIEYLNEKANKKFKVIQKHKDFIKARWNEGQRLEDFKQVIDNMVANWTGQFFNGKPAENYLQPSTLFGNKFDQYLNQKPKSKRDIFDRESGFDEELGF